MNRIPRMTGAWPALLLAACAAVPAARAGEAPGAEAFETLLKQAAQGLEDADLARILKLGRELGRPRDASAAFGASLAKRRKPGRELLREAAELAALAADYNSAISRYKAYLADAQPGPESSRAAGRLYELLVDFLRNDDAAYQFMAGSGFNLRQDPLARKFDGWFLRTAKARNDFVPYARKLAQILADKLPLPQEQLYWSELDWLLERVAEDYTGKADLVPVLKALEPAIRDEARRAACAYHRACLETLDWTSKWEQPLAAEAWKRLRAAAEARLKASPASSSLCGIATSFFKGWRHFDERFFRQNKAEIQAFFVDAFPLLPPDQKEAFIDWELHGRRMTGYLVPAARWAAWAEADPAFFQRPGPRRALLAFERAEGPDLYRQQAKWTAGAGGQAAAAIRCLAADGDLAALARQLFTQETWHLDFHEVYPTFSQYVAGAWLNYKRPKEQALPQHYWEKTRLDVGREFVAASPIAYFDAGAAQDYARLAWQFGGAEPGDKALAAGLLKALAWVPYDEKTRREAFERPYQEFRQWRKEFDKNGAGIPKEKHPALKAQLEELDAAYQALVSGKELAAPPNPLCKQLADLVAAARAKDREAYWKAARPVFEAHKDWNTAHTPYGAAMLSFAIQSGIRAFNDFEAPAALFKEELARLENEDDERRCVVLLNRIVSAKKEWNGGNNIQKSEMDAALKLVDLLDEALAAQLAQKRFWPRLYGALRNLKRGNGWRDQDHGLKTLAALIRNKTWLSDAYRPESWMRSGTLAYMQQVRDEFQGLRAEFPVETAFDELYLEEARKTGYLDYRYWHFGGQDKKRAIRDYAAQALAEWERYPSEASGVKPDYSGEALWELHRRLEESEPALRDACLDQLEARYGKTRFDSYAMGWCRFSQGWKDEAERAQWFQRLAGYMDRVSAAPFRVMAPRLQALAVFRSVKEAPSEAELDTLLRFFPAGRPDAWHGGWGYEYLVSAACAGLERYKRQDELFRYAPNLWEIARDTGNAQAQRALADLAGGLFREGRLHLALSVALAGLEIAGERLDKDAAAALASVRTQALSKVGGGLAVSRNDPNYPIFAAQERYLENNLTSAWELYAANAPRALAALKDLDPAFALWLVKRNTELQSFDAAEKLARVLLQHADGAPAGYDAEARAALQVAYADIAFARKEFPRARAQYEALAVNQAYKDTQAQKDALLRTAEVDRLTRQYDKALDQLERLAEHADRYLQTQAWYQIALVKFDQSQLLEAAEALDKALLRAPDHADAKLLKKEVLIAQKKYEAALNVVPGQLENQQILVPGAPLKVSLEDRNLAIVGKALTVEARVTTASGDVETFNLLPADDSKTRFQGQLPTRLGQAVPNDHVLQVLGADSIDYDYSPEFKAKHKVAESKPSRLTVRSDAELFVSSGAILTREELEARALERTLRQRLEREDAGAAESVALSDRREPNQVKPGNRINVRVADPDRSATAGIDEVLVSVETSSGDRVEGFALKETGPATGIFEGAVPTAGAQATAHASDSDEGSQPNHAISPGAYPAWRARPDNLRPKAFSVDLADSVALGKLTVLARDPARALKAFRVEISPNGRHFETVGSWPQPLPAWDGSPRVSVVKLGGRDVPRTLEQFRAYLDLGFIQAGTPVRTLDLPTQKRKEETCSGRLDGNVFDQRNLLKLNHDDLFLAHLQAGFVQRGHKVRTFKFVFDKSSPNCHAVIALDGQAGDEPGSVSRALKDGAHRIDVYLWCRVHHGTHFELQQDIEQEPFVAACPMDLFGVPKEAAKAAALQTPAAQITAAENNARFEVAFPAGARARVVRLLIEDYASDAPALDKLTLTAADGATVLPPKEDFQALRQNGQLEVVPGDRISVSYSDPQHITPDKAVLSASLSATFNDARLAAVDVREDRRAARADQKQTFIPIRRYKPGDNVTVFINDPDADTSAEPDQVTFRASTASGRKIEVQALETLPHSGIFLGRIFPVEAAAQRDVEIQVGRDEDLVLAYLDRENNDPGVPFERTHVVEQAWFVEPEFRVYEVSSSALQGQDLERAKHLAASASSTEETIVPTRRLLAACPALPTGAEPISAPVTGPLLAEIRFPTIAYTSLSEAVLYAQTSSGRAKAPNPQAPFDLAAPGTLKLVAAPGSPSRLKPPPGYLDVLLRGAAPAGLALEEGRFTFQVPLALGPLPEKSLVDWKPDEDAPAFERDEGAPKLLLNGADSIFLGFAYKDGAGEERWIVREVKLGGDIFFDLMDRRYREALGGAYVGEKVYFRLVHRTRDTTDARDHVELELAAPGGRKRTVQLAETFEHTGIFKGLVSLAHQDEAAPDDPSVFPVAYGDKVTVSYAPGPGHEHVTRVLEIFKGADGAVVPFTKRFQDPEIAVKTQFTIAEAYFEQAKTHRKLGEKELAQEEIATGKKILEEALLEHPDTESRVQADYLLANLALEFALENTDPEAGKKHYLEAIVRFSDLVTAYPDSGYAPKAQFKKAYAYEKMGDIDRACDEYVKLSYRYPEHELIAETISQLGQYFWKKGSDLKDQADKEKDPVGKEKLLIQARDMYRTAAEVLLRLSVRFPDHTLALNTKVLAGEAYMHATLLPEAVRTFKEVFEDPHPDKELAPRAMYWCGRSLYDQQDLINAYRVLKNLTWNYPETVWAKYARGMLTEEGFQQIDAQGGNQ
ncbi:MAG: tetratricopeptide repeat protein [Planctomycetota bacterium]|nr:tetratricopeptide repeat protein [Planctomycetota bacterium]